MASEEESEGNPPWRESKAKAALVKAINNGEVPLDSGREGGMTARDIYATLPELSAYDYSKFASRLRAVRQKIRTDEEPEEPKIKWQNSKAKDLLVQKLISGEITEEWSPEEVYRSISELSKYKFSLFAARLKRLRASVAESKSRAAEDDEAFCDFMSRSEPSLFSHKGYIQWQGSESQTLLQQDIHDNKHITQSKFQLWMSRSEYHESFPLTTFRSKIDQEIRTAKYIHTLKVKGKKLVRDW